MADDAANGDVHRTTFDTDQSQPNVDVTETVAALKNVESDELAPLYESIDHVIDNIFSKPPSDEADVEVSFNYEGFRVTISQDGNAAFRRRH